MESRVEVPPKLTLELPYDPADTCTPILTVALLPITKTWLLFPEHQPKSVHLEQKSLQLQKVGTEFYMVILTKHWRLSRVQLEPEKLLAAAVLQTPHILVGLTRRSPCTFSCWRWRKTPPLPDSGRLGGKSICSPKHGTSVSLGEILRPTSLQRQSTKYLTSAPQHHWGHPKRGKWETVSAQSGCRRHDTQCNVVS